MAYDAGNRRDIREAEKMAKIVEQQRHEIVTGIMSLPPGRSWMCDILESCHIFATSFADLGLRMAFMEGQRDIGLRLLNDIMRACPDQYVVMMRERNARQSTIDTRHERRRQDPDRSDSGQGPDDGSGGDDATNVDYLRDSYDDGKGPDNYRE